MRMVMEPKRVFLCCLAAAVFLSSLAGCTPAPKHNPVTAISLDKDKVTLDGVGTIVHVVATVSPADATNQNVIWRTQDSGVATVDRGYIKGAAVGTTTIEAVSEDGSKVARCEVTVTQAASTGGGSAEPPDTGSPATPTTPTTPTTPATPTTPTTPATPAKVVATGVALDKATLQLTAAGADAALVATISPGNADNKAVRWTSSNAAVATVTQDGKVTPVAKGSATITVTTEDGGHLAQCSVTVAGIAPTGVVLNLATINLTIADSAVELEATVSPRDADSGSIVWTSSNPLVAQVDQTGKVTPLAKGTATIRATTEIGRLTADCAVNITAVLPQGISLDKDSLTLFLGSTPVTLSATVLPANAENRTVVWSSSKPATATVDQSGKVTPVAEGTATITARTLAGDASIDCEVTVSKLVIVPLPPIIIGTVKVTGVSLDRARLDLVTGGNPYTLAAAIEPGQASNKKVSWSSSNPSVATVDQSGKVTPVAKGNAVITATTDDGGFRALCPVEVGTPNSFAPLGVVAFQGNWVYFTLYPGGISAHRGIYKIRTDGSELTQLSSDKAIGFVGVVGDWVYYNSNYALYRIRTDGTQRTLINNLDPAWSIHVAGSTIYYLSNGHVYRIGTNGENRVKVSDEYYIESMRLSGDYIYYVKAPAPGGTVNTGIYRMALNGSGRTKLASGDVKYFSIDADSQTILYSDGWLDGYFKTRLYSIRNDGSNRKLIGTDHYRDVTLTATDVFYYFEGAPNSASNGIYRMQTDGTLPMRISSVKDIGRSLYVSGDYVYFLGVESLYRVKKDGTGQVQLK